MVSIIFLAFFCTKNRSLSFTLDYSFGRGTFYLTLYFSLLVFYKKVDLFCFTMAMSFYWILFKAELSFSLSISSIFPFSRLVITKDKAIKDLLSLLVVKSSIHFSILRGFYVLNSDSSFWQTSLKRIYSWYEFTGLRDNWLMELKTTSKTR